MDALQSNYLGSMQGVRTILILIRWPNLILLGIIQYIVYLRMMEPGLSQLSHTHALTLMVITMLLAASGYVINDYYDHRIDVHNKPEKRVVGHTISLNAVLWLYRLILLTGAVWSVWLAFRLDLLAYLLIYPLAATGLWWYSKQLKCMPVIGNLWVSFFCAGAVLIMTIPDIVHHHARAIHSTIWYFSLFAFLATWWREVVKDLEDLDGDAREDCKTLPVKYGIPIGKGMAVILGILLMAAIYVWDTFYLKRDYAFIFTMLQGFMVAALLFIYLARDRVYFHYASQVIKGIMAGGTVLLFLN